MATDKYLNILRSRKVAEIATRNGRMRDVGNKKCISEERGQIANSGSSSPLPTKRFERKIFFGAIHLYIHNFSLVKLALYLN